MMCTSDCCLCGRCFPRCIYFHNFFFCREGISKIAKRMATRWGAPIGMGAVCTLNPKIHLLIAPHFFCLDSNACMAIIQMRVMNVQVCACIHMQMQPDCTCHGGLENETRLPLPHLFPFCVHSCDACLLLREIDATTKYLLHVSTRETCRTISSHSVVL
jgi:hypothetical protein